jgi:hypothetical protein
MGWPDFCGNFAIRAFGQMRPISLSVGQSVRALATLALNWLMYLALLDPHPR